MTPLAFVLTTWLLLIAALLAVGFTLSRRRDRAQASLAAILAEASGAPIFADLASQPRYLPLTWRWVPGPDPLGDERLAAVVAEWAVDS